MQQPAATKRTSISGGWKVVGGSACGIAFGSVVFFTSSFALFAAALGQQYNWTQIELSTGATIFLACLLVGWPVSGWVLDRLGTRKVSIASIALFGFGLALLSQIHTLPGFYFILALLGFAGTGTNVVSYARAITLWFDRTRGLALGVAASAQAFGATLLPLVAQKIIGKKGPSVALLTIAAIEAFLCIPAIAIFVTDSPGSSPQSSDCSKQNRQVSQSPLTGAELADVLRTSVFWKLCICFAIGGATVFTLSSNIVFILSQTAALRPEGVANVQAITGLAVFFGRVGCGFLLDVIRPPLVAAVTFAVAASAIALYAFSSSLPFIMVAAVLMGLSSGGESDIMPLMASRIFGTRAASKIFGWFLFAGGFFSAIGPLVFTHLATFKNGVALPLMILVTLEIVAALVFLSLKSEPPGSVIVAAS